MTRTFNYNFDPMGAGPVSGSQISLEVSDIENAGIREVLQTPGTAYGTWSILDALLTPTGAGTPFTFREPLGQAREVKVALSGLLGRFIARAYLEKYFRLAIFTHLGNQAIHLDRRLKVKVKRLSRGDLPDWIACTSDLSALTVAEAKGCHDVSGPAKALARAWTQAGRIDVVVGNRKATVKRIAIATRWGVLNSKISYPHISVQDPIDEGDFLEPIEKDAVFIGILRRHIANLLKPLGHVQLADTLLRMTQQPFAGRYEMEVKQAQALVDDAPVGDLEKGGPIGDLIGGVVTRTGPITEASVSPSDQETLARLDLRPFFVGIKRDVIRAAINGEPQTVRARLAEAISGEELARPDGAGGWVIPLGRELRIRGGI